MGAISGIFSFAAKRPVDPTVLERMSNTMHHRGPDGSGVWVDGIVGFAHRVLKIESEAGARQPLTNPSGTITVTFTGQIFNRRDLRRELEANGAALTNGYDSEVLLSSYEMHGERCVDLLRGQFAFAVWDARTDTLLLARDALGICPLHYAIVGGDLIFSSEAKGILAHPNVRTSSDDEAVAEALLCGAIFRNKSMFAGVNSVGPGSTVSASSAGCRTAVYWSVPRESDDGLSHDASFYSSQLPEMLQEAVTSEINGAHWGVLLSGGTDSSALTAFAQRASSEPVQTFSIDFPSRWRGADVDTHYAALVAAALGTRHRSFEADPEEYFSALEKLAWHVERPYNKAAATMYLLTSRLAPYAQYVMSGEGMDEMLAGYVGARGLGLEDGGNGGAIRRFPWAPYVETMEGLLSPDFRDKVRPLEVFKARLTDALAETAGADQLNQNLYLYTTYFLRELLALHEQGSLATGVETRFPFLDRRLVEFLTPLPSRFKFANSETKAVFRTAIRGMVPDEVLDRRKTHLPMPRDPGAVRRQLEIARELLCSPASRTARYLDTQKVVEFLGSRGAGQDTLTRWQVSMNLITLELLFRRFGV